MPWEFMVETLRNDMPPNGLGHGVGSISHTELQLHFLEMRSHRFLADAKILGYLLERHADRY
jgi:hypothetical protein